MGLSSLGRIIDTMIAAPIDSENRFKYALNELGKHYLGETKNETLLYKKRQKVGV